MSAREHKSIDRMVYIGNMIGNCCRFTIKQVAEEFGTSHAVVLGDMRFMAARMEYEFTSHTGIDGEYWTGTRPIRRWL